MTDQDEDAAPPASARPARLRPGRRGVVEKLWRAARRQLAAHEERLAALPKGAAGSEADAKTLATLARTVRELIALEAAADGHGTGGKPVDDDLPGDGSSRAAALRAELARRLDALAGEEAGAAPAPADPGA